MSMRDKVEQATDETGSTPVESSEAQNEKPAERRSFLRGAKRDLTNEELSSPVVIRFLLDEADKLERECESLRSTTRDYYAIRESLAVLKEKEKKSTTIEVLTTACLTVGSAGVGASKILIDVSIYGWVVGGLFLVFLLTGVGLKIWR